MMKKFEGDRAVSFLDADAAKWLHETAAAEGALEDGLCLARFHADHIVPGVAGWRVGEQKCADGNLYEVTSTGKRCFSECGLLQRTGKKCPLADGVAFGRPVDDRQEEQ